MTLSDMRAKPDFLVIGAMKCATSTVATYLENHPQVDMVAGTEPRYFSRDENYAKGPEWYARFFEGFSGDKLMGEGSNDYVAGARFPNTAARIAADLPDVKLVMMVRHPVKRVVSAWVQYRSNSGDFVPPDLNDAILERSDYLVDQSLYWKNLQSYREHFSDDQILIGFMEDIAVDPEPFWAELCVFLGIPHVPAARRIHDNSTQGKKVPGSTYSMLRRMKALKPVTSLLPRSTKRYLRDRVFSRPAQDMALLSEDSIAGLEKVFRPDARALLAHCGKPADFWMLE